MIIEMSCKNFLSFRDDINFSLLANSQKKHKSIRIEDNISILKTSVIFGANSSGKTNLLKLIDFIKNMVTASHDPRYNTYTFGYNPFKLNIRTINEPSFFEIVFVIGNNQKFKYNFTISGEEIIEENLYGRFTQKPTTIIQRKGQNFSIRKIDDINTNNINVRKDSLLLSKLIHEGASLANSIFEYFNNVHILQGSYNPLDNWKMFEEHGDTFKEFVLQYLKRADISIDNIEYEQEEVDIGTAPIELQKMIINDPNYRPNQKINQIKNDPIHNVFDDNGNIVGKMTFNREKEESQGTRQFYNFLGSLYNVCNNNKILFVDELDTSLHPLLVRMIIDIFNKKSNRSQLIFNSHDVSLLDSGLFENEQIWFADKDEYGKSEVYSLLEFKGLRKDTAKIDKKYLMGVFSGIPNIQYE